MSGPTARVRTLAAQLPASLQASTKLLAGQQFKQSNLPIVDLAHWDRSDEDRSQIAASIKRACEESGFFYLANHGVRAELMDAALSATREFFALPLEEKQEIEWRAFINEIHPPSARGYCALRGEGLDPSAKTDDKEFVDLGLDVDRLIQFPHAARPEDKPFCGRNKWPRVISEGEKTHIKEVLEEYISECKKAAERLLQAVALSLSLDVDFFRELTDDPVIIHRIIHYPAIKEFEESGLRISAGKHTDYGLVTLLYQVEYGLQMREASPSADTSQAPWVWVPPPPRDHLFTVNIGDCMQILTNGRYVSTMHRVVNAGGRDRYSMAFFFDPNVDAVLDPILLTPGEQAAGEKAQEPRFEPLAAGQVKLAKYQAVWQADSDLVRIEHGVAEEAVRDMLFRQ